jgi:hypothetical protein
VKNSGPCFSKQSECSKYSLHELYAIDNKMRKLISFVSLISFLSCSDPATIYGNWVLRRVVNNDPKYEALDCADIISFQKDQSYEVMNNCYSSDVVHPVVEIGSWNVRGGNLTLENREVLTDHVLFGKQGALAMRITQFTNNSLILNEGGVTYIFEREF